MPRHQRDPKLEQFWRRHIGQQLASGLNIRAYCRHHALNEPSFYSWRRIFRDRDRPAAIPAFLPVAVVDGPASRCDEPAIEIQFGAGPTIRVRNGCDRALLADVLARLQGQPATEGKPC